MNQRIQAYAGSEPYAFASYAHADANDVYDELSWLAGSGLNIWFDEGINPGAVWRDEIAAAIRNCKLFIFYASPASVASPTCLKEISFALDLNKPLLVTFIEPAALPDALKFSLADRQALLKYDLPIDKYREKLLVGVGLSAIGAQQVTDETAGTTQRSNQPAIAVLPFTNLSPDPEQVFFSEGLAEDILNGLSRIPDLTVRARASSFRLANADADMKSIGEMLNVTHLLSGSVRKSGSRIRVSVQLNQVTADRQIWADRYDRELEDVFEVQDEITATVLDELDIFLSAPAAPRNRGLNPLAYDAFLAGRHQFNQLALDKSIESLAEAIRIEPSYADALGELAMVHSAFIWWTLKPARLKVATIDEFADRALSIDPNQPAALLARSVKEFYVEHRYQEAIVTVHKLVAQNPTDSWIMMIYSSLLYTVRRADLAVSLQRRGIEVDPLSPLAHRQLAEGLLYAGFPHDAKQSAYQAERLGMPQAFLLTIIAAAQFDISGIEMQLARPANDWGNMRHMRHHFVVWIEKQAGNTGPVAEYVTKMRANPAYQIPFVKLQVDLMADDFDAAIDTLEQMIEDGEYLVIRDIPGRTNTLQTNDKVFNEARYHDILTSAGLDRESIDKIRVPRLPF